MADAVTPFLIEARNVRGAWVEIGSGVAAMLGQRSYAPDVRKLVGESCAAVALLAAQTAFETRLSLQFQRGQGALKLLVAQADPQLQVRGMAKADADAHGALDELMRGGILGLTIEGARGGHDYQALVEARGATLSQALERYFGQSEQLPTRLCLAGGAERLMGLLVQRLPPREGGDDDAHWEHVQAIFGTLSADELLTADPGELMLKLFAGEEVRVFDAKPVALQCRCSHASISAMLISLGKDELEQILAERGEVEVTCEFCGKTYRYTPGEMLELFAAIAARGDPATTRH
ncbi:MAG TPA: Hsp33 family molecular chaperone HslO [Verrucomicrobiae bacterium]|nr:Hsp33 family molecular chaperone HslO [Verrucomicrobiae bacterium]